MNSKINVEPNSYATSWRQTTVKPPGVQAGVRRFVRNLALYAKSMMDTRQERTFLRCLACHYVFDDQRDDFRTLIRMLKNRGDFIDTATCIAMANGDAKIDGRYFHLSFDDGFKNVISNALPILNDEQVPMIMFVPSAWTEADWQTARRYSIDIALYRQVVEMASWDDLRDMISAGFEIGSHTRTHVRLSTLSDKPDELKNELDGAKSEIERQLGRSCDYIAYPYGKPGDYDETTLAATKNAGYQAGFTIHRGSVVSGETDLLVIPRHHFEPEWPLAHIRYFANGNMEDYWQKKIAAARQAK